MSRVLSDPVDVMMVSCRYACRKEPEGAASTCLSPPADARQRANRARCRQVQELHARPPSAHAQSPSVVPRDGVGEPHAVRCPSVELSTGLSETNRPRALRPPWPRTLALEPIIFLVTDGLPFVAILSAAATSDLVQRAEAMTAFRLSCSSNYRGTDSTIQSN
jgi:hypothetical protein